MDNNKLFFLIAGLLVAGILALVFLNSLEKPAELSPESASTNDSDEETNFSPQTDETMDGDLVVENTIVLIETSKGEMKIKLFDNLVPKTAANFKKLVQDGFYDGTIFHRIIKDFMVQGGDPQGNGTGGPGYSIEDEFVQELRHNKKGILSMANSGPNTGGSQFFITLAPTPWLDDKHAIFGELIEGEEVFDTIGSAQTDEGDRPVEEIKVISMKVVDG